MTVPQGQAHQFTRVDKTLDISVSSESALPGVPKTPAAMQNRQRPPRNLSRKSQKMGKGHVATSSRLSQRRADVYPWRQYMCNVCGKEYAQRQGVVRHHREKHEASWCMYCREFKRGRPYLRLLREHLERQHPDVDPNAAVEVVKMNGRRATVTTPYPLQEPVSFPSLGHDIRVRTTSRLHPPIPPSPAVTKYPSTSLPAAAFPHVAYDPQFGFTEPMTRKCRRGNAHQFEVHNSYVRSGSPPFPFTEERSQVPRDTYTYASMKIRLALCLSDVDHFS
jgi:hypothetical protein